MTRRIYMLPIEPLDMRYSTQWTNWFRFAIEEDPRFELQIITADPLTQEIKNGAFLDVCGTNYFKAAQLMKIAELMDKGYVRDDDIFFLHDGWFPGVEMLAYMRDALKIDFKITGCFHAGTYDKTDYISKLGMGKWGRDIERGWFEIYDAMFVATHYHKKIMAGPRSFIKDKIHVTGFPLFPTSEPKVDYAGKENIILFPHRLTDDKQPHLFDKLQGIMGAEFPDWELIKTQETKRDKMQYYDLLVRSKIAVSFALHENWGIAMQEATLFGCFPVVPDRLSYMEIFSPEFRYKKGDWEVSNAYELIKALINNPACYENTLKQDIESIKRKGAMAIPNILCELNNL